MSNHSGVFWDSTKKHQVVAIRGSVVTLPLESNVGQLQTDGARRPPAGGALDGAQLDLGSWKVTEESVQQYLLAVGDALPVYLHYGLAPPIGLAAWALGSLLEWLDLPPGAIHSFQEIKALGPVPYGVAITGAASLARPRRRGDLELMTADFTLMESAGREVLSGKSTVLVARRNPPRPSDTAPGAGPEGHRDDPGLTLSAGKEAAEEEGLTKVVKTISQAQLNAYAQASGDHNPLHLDPGFAATTQFGAVIAHGMLTLAFISEMMAGGFGRAWLETGTLNVRFKGAAYLGEEVSTWGRVIKEVQLSHGRRLECAVGLRNLATGRDLITGTATLCL